MACASCGSQGPIYLNPGGLNIMSEQADYPKVQVQIHGATAAVQIVGPATRFKYGRHKAGDIIWIHKADAAADPERFVPVTSAKESLTGVPQSPDEVRAVKPVLQVEQESGSVESTPEPGSATEASDAQTETVEAITEVPAVAVEETPEAPPSSPEAVATEPSTDASTESQDGSEVPTIEQIAAELSEPIAGEAGGEDADTSGTAIS